MNHPAEEIQGFHVDVDALDDDYIEVCPDCEQAYDVRDFDEYLHHKSTPWHFPRPRH